MKGKKFDQNVDPWFSGPGLDKYLDITPQTRRLWLAEGKLPEGVPVSTKTKRWKKSWIDSAMEKLREGGEA